MIWIVLDDLSISYGFLYLDQGYCLILHCLTGMVSDADSSQGRQGLYLYKYRFYVHQRVSLIISFLPHFTTVMKPPLPLSGFLWYSYTKQQLPEKVCFTGPT